MSIKFKVEQSIWLAAAGPFSVSYWWNLPQFHNIKHVTEGRFLRPFGSKRAEPERFCYTKC